MIRKLLADNPMPGRVALSFEREPDYFLGESAGGDKTVTLKAVDQETGTLAGIMCLSEARRYVCGEVRLVGYLGGVRIDHAYRGYLLPMRSFPYVVRYVRRGWPDLWFAAIVNNNPAAEHIFYRRARRSFPRLERLGGIHTLALFTRSRRVPEFGKGMSCATAADVGFPAVAEFLHRDGPHREFFPVYTETDFSGGIRFPGLEACDVMVVLRAGAIVGVCGVWDQSGFKQTVVSSYTGWLRAARPVLNSVGPVVGLKRLPAPGEHIRAATIIALSVADDEAQVCRLLLATALRTASAMGMDYLMVGLAERDPLLTVARSHRHILYRSSMFAFTFGKKPTTDLICAGKIPHLEIAAV